MRHFHARVIKKYVPLLSDFFVIKCNPLSEVETFKDGDWFDELL